MLKLHKTHGCWVDRGNKGPSSIYSYIMWWAAHTIPPAVNIKRVLRTISVTVRPFVLCPCMNTAHAARAKLNARGRSSTHSGCVLSCCLQIKSELWYLLHRTAFILFLCSTGSNDRDVLVDLLTIRRSTSWREQFRRTFLHLIFIEMLYNTHVF